MIFTYKTLEKTNQWQGDQREISSCLGWSGVGWGGEEERWRLTAMGPTLLQIATFHSFWWPSNIPLYISSLSIPLSMDIWALSIVWLLWTLLLQTLWCRCPFGSICLYPLGKYLVVQFLGHRVVYLFLFEWECKRERAWVGEGAEGETDSPLHRVPDVRLNPRTLRSQPELKADTQLTESPTCPIT